MRVALHIFRRDLRLQDNTALNVALKEAEQVIPCFIFDSRQVRRNPYKSQSALTFMHGALADLDQALKQRGGRLYLFEGIAEKVVATLISRVDLVTLNRDYTPFARKRDASIEQLCRRAGVEFVSCADALLQEPESVHKDDGTPYTIYTPFAKRAKLLPVRTPDSCRHSRFTTKKLPGEASINLGPPGGKSVGLKLLAKVKTLKKYAELRDVPAADYTTHLSPHNKFGTLSIREVYHKIKSTFSSNHLLISELYWRDFFTHILFHHPHVLGNPFHKKYAQIRWRKDPKRFKAWCEGKTGFPIVDAGMRELNSTGFMHNRVRMITASFLVKDLHLDWRLGERYFAQQLIDYDPAVNNGNWQWAASTGCDAQPYFRIFNPWSQQEKFDPDGEYVERWCPNHQLKPIVDHKSAAEQAKKLYVKR